MYYVIYKQILKDKKKKKNAQAKHYETKQNKKPATNNSNKKNPNTPKIPLSSFCVFTARHRVLPQEWSVYPETLHWRKHFQFVIWK